MKHLKQRTMRGFEDSRLHRCAVERMENRTLMAAWGTEDAFALAPGQTASPGQMATDAAGNIWAAGGVTDESGLYHGILREKAAATGAWSTVLDYAAPAGYTNAYLSGITFDAAGNLYLSGNNYGPSGGSTVYQAFALKRKAGQSSFSVIDTFNTQNYVCYGHLTCDASGNLFVAAGLKESDNFTHALVRELPAGKTKFTTVDDYLYPSHSSIGYTFPAVDIRAVTSGPAKGIYVVEESQSGVHWLVRKSSNGTSGWKLVDDFQSGTAGISAEAYQFIAAADGSVCVTGTSGGHTIVRRSASGNAGSWGIDLDLAGGGGSKVAGGADQVGNLFIAESAANLGDHLSHTLVLTKPYDPMTKTYGSWTQVDDYIAPLGGGLWACPGCFAAGNDGTHYFLMALRDVTTQKFTWTIRSDAAPAAPAGMFSSTQITGSTNPTAADLVLRTSDLDLMNSL